MRHTENTRVNTRNARKKSDTQTRTFREPLIGKHLIGIWNHCKKTQMVASHTSQREFLIEKSSNISKAKLSTQHRRNSNREKLTGQTSNAQRRNTNLTSQLTLWVKVQDFLKSFHSTFDGIGVGSTRENKKQGRHTRSIGEGLTNRTTIVDRQHIDDTVAVDYDTTLVLVT